MAGLVRMSDQRPSSTIASKYDVPPPVTTYASSPSRTPLMSQNQVPASTNRSGSMVVNRRLRRVGQQFFYSHGGVSMPTPISGAAEGGVVNSRSQMVNVQLMDWQKNTEWFAAGYPRNLGYVTRVAQPQTNASGGNGSSVMASKPIFPKVQKVPRYQAIPPSYPTRSTNM